MSLLEIPQRAPVLHLGLVLVCGLSIWTDLRRQEIWDLVTLPGLLYGLVVGSILGGWDGALRQAGGALFGLLVFGSFWVLGLMESGDVLLMTAIGALLGFPAAATAALLACLFALPVALAWVAWRREVGRALGNLGRLFAAGWRGGTTGPQDLTPFPFGVAVGLAGLYVAACAYFPWLAIWR